MKKEYSYEYQDDKDLYCYPGTKVLRNKLGISDYETLQEAEREISMAKYYYLEKAKVEGDFSLKMLQIIHKELFGDIYEWAGEIRKVDIAKGTIFCLVPFIEEQFDSFYQWLKDRRFLKDEEDEDEYVKDLAYVLGEINMIHPFREGNGRSQRLYMEKLVMARLMEDLNYTLITLLKKK
ncbi:MAG: Fic/DOC family protein [Lachnospiraceae bacterium]